MGEMTARDPKTSAAFKRELGDVETTAAPKKVETDRREFQRIQSLTESMIKADAVRNKMFKGMEDIYRMNWVGAGSQDIRDTVSPDCHNTIRGLVDLLAGAKPDIKIPRDPDSQEGEEIASKIEKTLELIRRRFNRLRGSDVEEEAVLTGSLFGVVVLKYAYVSATADAIEDQAKKHNLDPEKRKRLKEQVEFYQDLSKRSPFMVDVLNPMTIHFQRGPDGLRSVVECQQKTVADIRAEWGEHLLVTRQPGEDVMYREYWDRFQYCKWVDDTPLDMGTNSSIPYIVKDINGTRVFGNTEYFPILYAVWKGDLWAALNLVLTMMRSNVFAFGNPAWICTGKSAHDADIPFNMASVRIDLDPGDSITPLTKDLNTTDNQLLYSTFRQLIEESTLGKLLLGKAPEHLLAFSTVNMLIQGEKSKLSLLQLGVADALSELFEKMLILVANGGKTLTMFGKGAMTELKPADIDVDRIEVLVELKPNIPQDRLQLLNMAKMGVDAGLASKYSARELAGWMQPDEEEERITEEQLFEVIKQMKFQEIAQPQEQQPGAPQQLGTPEPTTPPSPFIPPKGYTEADAGLPAVQSVGEPPPEFTRSAEQNMEPQ